MLYIFEKKLSEEKLSFQALTSLYGIGKSTSIFLCKILGFSKNLKIKHLTQDQINSLLKLVELKGYKLNNELKKSNSTLLRKLISIKSYKGLRKLSGLPVRGQRTRTNSRSSRNIRPHY